MTERRLGRRAPSNRRALRLGGVLTGTIPAHPASADHFAEVSDWGLFANDTYGDCGPVSVANSRKLITRYLGGAEAEPTLDDVLALYKLVNPAFDPKDPGGPGDAGVDMQQMLELALEHGFAGVKPLAFAKVDTSNLDELRAAISIFGCVLLGVNLQTAQQHQTDEDHEWDYKRSPEWGGHAVLCGRYTDNVTLTSGTGRRGTSSIDLTGVVTWGEVVDMTDAFLAHQLEEAWVVIWPEHLGTAAFQQGVDLPQLAADYRALTGGKPFPAPAPTPAADPLTELAAMFRQWVAGVEAWFKKHNL